MAIICFLAVTVCSGQMQKNNSLKEAGEIDFRKIISKAKKEVFPALIFVKPIVEEYSSGERKQQEVFGSGVIISADGYAVTNHHVIDKAIAINCVLYNKRQMPVKLVGFDRDTDLALLKLPVEGKDCNFPFAKFCTKDVSEGDFVMALGSPYGFQRSISLGIISNANRYLGFESEYKYNTWIQTDAAINPGNSGGPLIDTEGYIVGINTLGISGTGLGFSIPASVVQDIVEKLKRDGSVIRSYTGLRLQAIKDFYSNTFVNSDRGVLIAGVEENSPAAKNGIRAGDILLEVNGRTIDGTYAEMLPAIWRLLADLNLEKNVEFKILRAGKETVVTFIPEQKGKVEGEDFDCKKWQMTIKEINKYRNPTLYYIQGEGVFIQGVKYPGNASDSDLKSMDIIIKIDNKPVKTIEDVKKIYQQIVDNKKREKKVMLEIKRGGLRNWIVLDYQKDYDEE
jgi:serine protease Do